MLTKNKIKSIFIHPSAIVENAKIGNGTKIWHWVHVCKGAEIGNNVTLGQNVFVGSKAKIGDNCKIQNNVSVYDNVELKKDVFCGPSVVFTNVYNPRAFIERKTEYKKTIVKQGATLGANSTIVCGVTIGKFAFVGAGALVNKNILDFALIVGVPAIQIGWISKIGERLALPLTGYGQATCSKSGLKYYLKKNKLYIDKTNEN